MDLFVQSRQFLANVFINRQPQITISFSGIKANDDNHVDMSDSEEDEYNNSGIVYDSENSEDEFDSGDEEIVSLPKILLVFSFWPGLFLFIEFWYVSHVYQQVCINKLTSAAFK